MLSATKVGKYVSMRSADEILCVSLSAFTISSKSSRFLSSRIEKPAPSFTFGSLSAV